jgi:imidazole glycerol-phosphate synthase subunit HisF
MLKKRIIPCLDIRDGRTVKGIQFENIQDAGDPVELAERYMSEGADELIFLDITATVEKRKTLIQLVSQIASVVQIPFTVGGGIQRIEDVRSLIDAGADKISINSAAFLKPKLISDIAAIFGSQCVVVAIDTFFNGEDWYVCLNGGRTPTDAKAEEWAKMASSAGAGEILLTSMNKDGTKSGFALDITSRIADAVSVPVIASGGAGNPEHFFEVFTKTKATGALAASVFHFGELTIPLLKQYLSDQKISIRL